MLHKLRFLFFFSAIWEIAVFFVGFDNLPHIYTIVSESFIAIEEHRVLVSRREVDDGLFLHIALTFFRAIVSVVLGLIFGVSLSLIVHRYRCYRLPVEIVTDSLRSIPPILFIPVFVVLFGISGRVIFILGFLFSLTSTLIYCKSALLINSEILMDQARLYGMNWSEVSRKILLPQILITVQGGLRLTIAMVVGVVMVAEYFVGSYGLGRVLALALFSGSTQLIFIVLFWSLIITMIIDSVYTMSTEFLFKMRYHRTQF